MKSITLKAINKRWEHAPRTYRFDLRKGKVAATWLLLKVGGQVAMGTISRHELEALLDQPSWHTTFHWPVRFGRASFYVGCQKFSYAQVKKVLALFPKKKRAVASKLLKGKSRATARGKGKIK